MSRCFPYPPPGFVRNTVAVAEAESTAKLQKEREKAEKKLKRKEKKALQQDEASKHSKHSHKKRKHEAISTATLESKKLTKESVEQLEKSGLSEEHGVPFIQTVQGSPESSQDSSKRRKVVLPGPRQPKNGNIVRIKIKGNPDSPAAVLEKPKILEPPSVQQMGHGSSLLGQQNSIQHHTTGGVISRAAPPEQINGGSPVVQKQESMELPAQIMQRVDPKTTGKVLHNMDPLASTKAPVRRADLPANSLGSIEPRVGRATGRFEPIPAKTAQWVQPSPKLSQSVDPQLPQVPGRLPSASVKEVQNETGNETRTVWRPEAPQPSVIKQDQEPVTCVPIDKPCFSGRADPISAQEAKQSKSDRKRSRKAEKKEKKYRDLFVTWKPPSLEMEDSGPGELDDWLLGGTKNTDASKNCRASDGSVSLQSEQCPSLQPRATFLPDLNIYQLPYVVPF